jgi:hypothetical protein
MGPLSRFEKIEAERTAREPSDAPEPRRFLATETPAPLAEPTPPPTERFGHPEDELRTADPELAWLPTLVCEVCGTESSKFASHCRACASSLESPAARAFNLERLARLQAEAAAAAAPPAPPVVALEPPESVAPAPDWGERLRALPRWAQVLGALALLAVFGRRALVLALAALAAVLLYRAWRRR